MEFEDSEGNFVMFSELYDYHKFLGCGSFGFVVSAVDRSTGELLALKVYKYSIYPQYCQFTLIYFVNVRL